MQDLDADQFPSGDSTPTLDPSLVPYTNPGVITLSRNADTDRMRVTKSNRLVDALIRLGAREQKVLAACISVINPAGHYPNGLKVQLTDEQLQGLTGIEKRHLYRFMDEAARKYHSVPIEAPGKKKGTVDYINIAHRSVYDPEERVFTITFHSDMEEELLKLQIYTSYTLSQLTRMSSKYSMRLFEQFEKLYNDKRGGMQHFKVSLEELYFPLGLKDSKGSVLVPSYIADYASFRRKCLEPAVSEINEKTDFDVEFAPYKVGKSYRGLNISLRRTSKQLKIGRLDGERQVPVEERLLNVMPNKRIADRVFQEYGPNVVEANLDYMQKIVEGGADIRSPAAYLMNLLKFNIAGLPPVANPYSERYDRLFVVKSFVNHILMPAWWNLSARQRQIIESFDDITSNPLTADTYAYFAQLLRDGTAAEDAVMFMDLDDFLVEVDLKSKEFDQAVRE